MSSSIDESSKSTVIITPTSGKLMTHNQALEWIESKRALSRKLDSISEPLSGRPSGRATGLIRRLTGSSRTGSSRPSTWSERSGKLASEITTNRSHWGCVNETGPSADQAMDPGDRKIFDGINSELVALAEELEAARLSKADQLQRTNTATLKTTRAPWILRSGTM